MMGAHRTFKGRRGGSSGGVLTDFTVEGNGGAAGLDGIPRLQATQAPDLAVRWNCKAGKCGSCSMEINGKPRLACMTRVNVVRAAQPHPAQPLKTFPGIKDLVTDVSWNYEQNKRIRPFKPRPKQPDGTHRMY